MPRRRARSPSSSRAAPLATLPRESRDDAVAQILFTSGTTGTAKAAAVSHASLAAHTLAVARTVGLGADDVVLGTLPLTHSFGCRMVMLLALADRRAHRADAPLRRGARAGAPRRRRA